MRRILSLAADAGVMVRDATFTIRGNVTARRKPTKRAAPINAPGWLAIVLLAALLCIIGAALLSA